MVKIDLNKVEREFGYLKIGNKHYELIINRDSDGLQKFVEIKDYDKRLALAKELTQKLKKNLDKEKIMMEVLMKSKNLKMLQDLKKELTKKSTKPKTRRHHCVDMKVGKFILPIVE